MSGASGVGAAGARLLEREQELAALTALVEDAASGQARLVIVEGPAGIGKTQLLTEARRRAPEAGLRVLSARGGELEREYAFGVVRQLFEPALASPGARERLLAGAAAPAGTLFEPVALEASPEADSSFAVLHGLYWLTVNLSAEQPLLLSVDDLHWCDRASLRFLAFLVRRLEGLPVLGVASLRTAEPGVDAALLVELLGDPLDGAAPPEAAQRDGRWRARARPPRRRGRPGVRGVVPRGDGRQPAAPERAAQGARDRGRPARREPRGDGARARAARRLARRARAARAAARRRGRGRARGRGARRRRRPRRGRGARRGRPAGGCHGDRAARARRDHAAPSPPLGFVHPLVAGAVYRDIPPGERELQHERAAKLLAEGGAPPEQVAAHLLAIPARGEAWVVATLEHAATAALHKGAPESAVAYLTRALAEPPPAGEEGAVLLELGVAEVLTSGPAATEHLSLAYERLDDWALRATAAQHLVRALLFTGDPAASAAVARAVAEELPEELADLRRAFEAAELATVLFGTGELSALRIQRPEGDAGGLGAKMLAAVEAIEGAYSGRPAAECAVVALEALAGGDLIAADNGGFFTMAAVIVLVGAEHPQADAIWQEARADAHRRGSLFAAGALNLWYGYTLLRRGELAEARQELEAAFAAFESWGYGSLAEVYVRTFLALTLLEQGETSEARRVLERGGDPPDFAADGARYWLVSRLALEVAEGRAEEAVATAERIARDYPDVVNVGFNPWRSLAAEAHDRLGHREQALALAAEEVELARRWGAPGELGRTLRVLGTLEREEGLDHLREAVDLLAGSPARLEHAKALAALGSALRRFRKPTEAREPLRLALELADACGAAALAEDVRTELYATGARPRSTAASGVGSLTAAELRVVNLAADGLTNRDIAQTLFVTPKTVEVHLSNAYRKLGISSRRELAGVLS